MEYMLAFLGHLFITFSDLFCLCFCRAFRFCRALIFVKDVVFFPPPKIVILTIFSVFLKPPEGPRLVMFQTRFNWRILRSALNVKKCLWATRACNTERMPNKCFKNGLGFYILCKKTLQNIGCHNERRDQNWKMKKNVCELHLVAVNATSRSDTHIGSERCCCSSRRNYCQARNFGEILVRGLLASRG